MLFETSLIQSIKQNNTGAFTLLYEKYSPAVYRCILRITSDKALACLLLEKSFCTIWHSIDEYNPSQQSLFNWILQTTLKQCQQKLKLGNAEIVHRMSYQPANRYGFTYLDTSVCSTKFKKPGATSNNNRASVTD